MTVEPPLRVERREELLWLLVQACELEHGLMCEYLFAQFTLKRGTDEGLTDEQLAKVAAWEAVIVDVTKQEMLHLACQRPLCPSDIRSLRPTRRTPRLPVGLPTLQLRARSGRGGCSERGRARR